MSVAPIETSAPGDEQICPCGAFSPATSKERCRVCGRRAWQRRRLGGFLLPRVLPVVAVTVLAGAWALVAMAGRPDESAQIRRLRDSAADALARGDDRGAAAMLETCVSKRPDDATAWRMLALARLRFGDVARALEAARHAFDANPDAPEVASLFARCLLETGDARAAARVAARAPEPSARIVEARALATLGRPAAAADALARGGLPADDVASLVLATRLSSDLASQSFPGSTKRAAQAAENAKRLAQAADAAAKRDPRDPTAALGLAVAAEVDPKVDRAQVARLFDRAAELETAGTSARTGRVRFLVRTGRVDDARAAVESAARAGDSALALAGADALAKRGDLDGAATALRALTAADPADGWARASLVRALLASGKAREALEAADGGPERGPWRRDLLYAAGDAAAAAGDRAKADASYDAALALAPDDADVLLRRHGPALERLAQSLAALRAPSPDEVAARTALDRVRGRDPDAPGALRWAALVAAAEGKAHEAFVLAARRGEITPEDQDARFSLYAAAAAGATDAEIDALAERLVSDEATPAVDLRAFAAQALRRGRAKVAARLAAAAVARWPADESLRLLHAQTLLATGDAKGAETRVLQAFGAEPKSSDARELLAWARGLGGAADAALATLPPSEDRDENAARARLALGLGRFDEAEAALRRALAKSPGDAPLLRILAETLLARGKAAEAAEVLEPAYLDAEAELSTLVLTGEALAVAFPDAGAASGRLAALRTRMAARRDGGVDVLRLDARLAAAKGDLAEADALLARYLERRPADGRAWYEASQIRAKTGGPDAEAEALRRALEAVPSLGEARVALAKILFARASKSFDAGDAAAAQAALEETVALVPGWTRARTTLALVLYSRGLTDECAEQSKAVLDRDPRDVAARLFLAMSKHARGASDAALVDLDALVAEHPEIGVLRVQRGLVRLRSSRIADAAADFRAAAAAGWSGADLEYGLAGCALAEGRADEALAHARRAVELAPNSAQARHLLGAALALAGKADAAVAAFDEALARDPADEASAVAAASVLVQSERWQEAFDRTNRLEKPSGRALYLRAESALRLGRGADARRWFRQAAPDFPAAWMRAAVLSEESGDKNAAATEFAGAVASGVSDRGVRLHLSVLLVETRRVAEAAQVLEALLAEKPDDVGAMNNLALALAADVEEPPLVVGAEKAARRAELLARPLALATKARGLAPGSADVADTVGWVRYLAADFAGARTAFEDALRLGPCADARFHLALLDLRDDRFDAAREGLRRALDEAPDAAWATRARGFLK